MNLPKIFGYSMKGQTPSFPHFFHVKNSLKCNLLSKIGTECEIWLLTNGSFSFDCTVVNVNVWNCSQDTL